jgi:hypothetical protein
MDPLELAKSVKPLNANEYYRGGHQAPRRSDDVGAPLHDTTGVYPADFYGPKGLHYYGDATDPIDQESYRHTVKLKGNPEAFISVHRAIPTEIYKQALKQEVPLNHMIRPGDWVTPTKAYAKLHGDSVLNGKYKIASRKVRAKDVFTNGDSLNEWGYDPEITKNRGGIVGLAHSIRPVARTKKT